MDSQLYTSQLPFSVHSEEIEIEFKHPPAVNVLFGDKDLDKIPWNSEGKLVIFVQKMDFTTSFTKDFQEQFSKTHWKKNENSQFVTTRSHHRHHKTLIGRWYRLPL